MISILVFVNCILLVISFILIRNRFLFKPLTSVPVYRLNGLPDSDLPGISVCIPARNEEKNIRRCVESLIMQDYPGFEILVLNDQSTDNTKQILDEITELSPDRLRVFNGSEKPDGWLGKQWACHQLSRHATGDILIFADADTWYEPGAIKRTAAAFINYDVDMLTVWPRQYLKTFWENMIIPLVYYALTGFLPTHYTFRKPLWLPVHLYHKLSHHFAAACGQFIAFRSVVYHITGGHVAVKDKIVEDVELAKLCRKNKFNVLMMHGMNSISCRMYYDEASVRQGFRKNFLAGFGNNVFLFTLAAIFQIIVFVLPFIIPFLYHDPVIQILAGIAVILILLHRLLLATWFKWEPMYALLHPLGVLWFQFLGILVVTDYLFKRKVTWKKRQI